MITLNDLKSVPMLQGLGDEALKKMLPLAHIETYAEDQIIYETNSHAENFYIVRSGKALLEGDLNEDVTVSLAALKPGYLFGWYALLPNSNHTMRARATESSEIIVIPGDGLRMLMDEDHDFGYRLMNRLYMLLKIRLDHRSEQFMKILARHPDLTSGTED
ncbi:CRP-like cAMP-binding protein [Desulfobaculum xiamenense]|uniref:CRP-like cAMP-binding protein n=1 Tax=Desulfobaculum xiamenense TaxID=995050 RepID=A0A846QFL3_9BACT|nr:cyclic nucleotide-binding domain-containing protein [Desulfobaculum xiamenense]NJB67118.1 CRP-like cAMP-binding protein [Desulfobaculum xiamenense]